MKNNPQLYFLAGLWVSWSFLHSLLISHRFTDLMRGFLKERFAYYRLGFNLFSLLTIIPITVYQGSMEQEILFAYEGFWQMPQDVLLVFGFLLFYSGFMTYDMRYVAGIRQIQEYREKKRDAPMGFKAIGILKFVRHPWYTAAFMLIWASGPITDVNLIAKIILTVYIIIGTVLEERKLLAEIGRPYELYRRRVPMFFPFKIF